MDRQYVEKWLTNLKEFWLSKDVVGIETLFKDTKFYQETPFMKPYTTLKEVVDEWWSIDNSNIQNLSLEILAIDGFTVIVHWVLKQANQNFDGIYELKFNQNLNCTYFKSWEMAEPVEV